jgi:hypothetical protein
MHACAGKHEALKLAPCAQACALVSALLSALLRLAAQHLQASNLASFDAEVLSTAPLAAAPACPRAHRGPV